MKASWGPRKFPVRDPRSTKQQQGRIVNPPRGLKLGGSGEHSLLNTQKRQSGTDGPDGKGPVSDRGR